MLVVPMLDIVLPHVRPGVGLLHEWALTSPAGYVDPFHVKVLESTFRTVTSPFGGGLEIKTPGRKIAMASGMLAA